MKKIVLSFALIALLAGCNAPANQTEKTEEVAQTETLKPTESAIKNLEVYPAAAEGMKRYVILPDSLGSEAEYEYKVELIPGKMAEVDNCNRHGLLGELTEKTIEGFGYNYYEFASNGDIFSTQMACLDAAKINKFVPAKTSIIRYNSLLPIVVYMPEGFELKYKIWAAGEEKEAGQ